MPVLCQVGRASAQRPCLESEAEKVGHHIPGEDKKRTHEKIEKHVVVIEPGVRLINQASQ